MNQRVADILNYLDQSEQPTSTQTEQTTPSPVSDDEEVEVTPAKPIIPSSSPPSSTSIDLNMFNDDKVYNKLARQLKKNKFPMIFEGQVLNSESEAQMFKQQVLASRRDYKRGLKQKKIQESQMNFEAMPTLNEDDFEDLYEEDGYVYKKSKYPYAIHKDGKKKLIPKTSAKDTKKIYKSIESTSGKEGIKHLVKAGTSEEFKTRSDEVMNKVNDEELRNSYYNHTHNDFADDKTWNQESFLKLIYNMMKENEELKSNVKKQQQQQTQQQPKPSNPFRINPALMKK
jgi:hypothetical protein